MLLDLPLLLQNEYCVGVDSAATYIERFGEPADLLENSFGTCLVWQTRNVLVTWVTGRFKPLFCEAVIAGFDRAAKNGRVMAFHDWDGVESYDISVQARFTTHGAINVAKAEQLLFLASHAVVRAAISTTNMVYKGKLQVVSSGKFQSELGLFIPMSGQDKQL